MAFYTPMPYRQMVGYFFNNGFVAAVLHFELAVETFFIARFFTSCIDVL